MAIRNALPFEFPFRWSDVREWFGLEIQAVATMEERDRAIEDYLASMTRPLIVHWHGSVDDHIDVRNGPGWFDQEGALTRIVYVSDVAPASGVTVKWYFGGSATAAWTHTLGTSGLQTETESTPYAGVPFVAVVTAADATASGLTAFVFQG